MDGKDNPNSLLSEAQKLGGKPHDMSGQVFAKRPITGQPGKFFIIAMNFYDSSDLMRVTNFIEKHKLQGFTEPPPEIITQGGMSQFAGPQIAPKCRIHGGPMKWSDKRHEWYCPKKLADQTYCVEVVK